MKAQLAAVREFIAILPESPDQQRALDALHQMEAGIYDLPADPVAHKVATEALIQSLTQRAEIAEASEAHLLQCCRNLQEKLAEARGMPRDITLRTAY